MKKEIAKALHCNPQPIPAAYEKKARDLAARYAEDFSLSGFYRIETEIVYNHICYLVNCNLSINPDFGVDTFSDHINADNLFYGMDGIRAVIAAYKKSPNDAFPYILCYFSRKLCSFRKNSYTYTKGLDPEEVDAVLVIALYKVLDAYDFTKPFSFDYLTLELRSALTELGGQMHPFGMNRNDFMLYKRLSYLIDKYSLNAETLPLFLSELNYPYRELPPALRHFQIEEVDLTHPCKISRKKMSAFYALYCIESMGYISDLSVAGENDSLIDNLCMDFENGYSDVELQLFASLYLQSDTERRIFEHLSNPGGGTITGKQLEELNTTRYAISKLKENIFREIL